MSYFRGSKSSKMKTATLIIILGLVISSALNAMEFYVSPQAQAGGDGSSEKPFTSIGEARMAARDWVVKETVTIWLLDGTYYLDSSLVFGPEDGGMAYEGEVFRAEVPEDIQIDQLFINQQRQGMARFPNAKSGYNVFDCWTLSHKAGPDPENDPLAEEKVAGWSNPEGAYLHAMHRANWNWKGAGRITGQTGCIKPTDLSSMCSRSWMHRESGTTTGLALCYIISPWLARIWIRHWWRWSACLTWWSFRVAVRFP